MRSSLLGVESTGKGRKIDAMGFAAGDANWKGYHS